LLPAVRAAASSPDGQDTAVAFTAVASIVVQWCALEWRWASVLLPSVPLLREHTTRRAADIILTLRATNGLVPVIESPVSAALVSAARPRRAGTARKALRRSQSRCACPEDKLLAALSRDDLNLF